MSVNTIAVSGTPTEQIMLHAVLVSHAFLDLDSARRSEPRRSKTCYDPITQGFQLCPSGCTDTPSHLRVVRNDWFNFLGSTGLENIAQAYRSAPSLCRSLCRALCELASSVGEEQISRSKPERLHPRRSALPMGRMLRVR